MLPKSATVTGSVFRLVLQLNLLIIPSPEPHRPTFSLVYIFGAHPSQMLPCFYVFASHIVRLAVLLMHVKSVSHTEDDFSHFWGNSWSRCSFHKAMGIIFLFFWLNTSLKISPDAPWPGHLLVSDPSESKKSIFSELPFHAGRQAKEEPDVSRESRVSQLKCFPQLQITLKWTCFRFLGMTFECCK